MKKLLFIFLLTLCGTMVFAQNKMTCCNQSATQKFAMLASSKSFRLSHKNPLPLHFQSSIGKTISYQTDDGKNANAYELRAKRPTNNYLLVIHEWWGLNDYVKREAEKLYTDIGDVNVIAIDLYDGKVAATREQAGQYMQGVKEDRALAIINGALVYAGAHARIATIGWCFGGGWSLQTALLAGKQTVACVMYYGMPEQDVNKLKSLHGDVLGNFANKDQWINTKVVAKFAADMQTAGKKLYLHQYEADHGFANPSNPVYDNAASKSAYTFTLGYLKTRLK